MASPADYTLVTHLPVQQQELLCFPNLGISEGYTPRLEVTRCRDFSKTLTYVKRPSNLRVLHLEQGSPGTSLSFSPESPNPRPNAQRHP